MKDRNSGQGNCKLLLVKILTLTPNKTLSHYSAKYHS